MASFVYVLFGLTVLATSLFFSSYVWKSSFLSRPQKIAVIFVGQVVWLAFQAALTLSHFYSSHLDSQPPRLLLFGNLPPMLLIVVLFLTGKGRRFIDSLPIKGVLWLNIVRVPVEVVLYLLFLDKMVPKLVTFEGGNLDILSGLTAPLIVYLGFKKGGEMRRRLVLVWSFLCLGLLFNVVIRAMLSMPFPSQKLAFDQPNIAAFYFPFNWLVTFIVPLVLFGHLTVIRRILVGRS